MIFHMRRYLRLIVLMAFLLPPSDSRAAEVVRIGGSGSDLGSIKILAAGFERSHPGIQVQVLPSLGSGGGIRAVASGAIDIGLLIRELGNDELKLGLRTLRYARTPFVFAAHKGVRPDDITTAELISVLNGTRTTWPDGQRMRLVLRPSTEYEMTILKTLSAEVARALDTALGRPGMLSALTAQECASILESTPGAIGFSNLGLLRSEKRQLKALSFNGTAPTTKNAAAGTYPLRLDHFFVVGPEPPHAVLAFIRYVFSPAGRKVLEETGHEALAGGL